MKLLEGLLSKKKYLVSRGEWPDPLEVVQILEEAISAGVFQRP